MITREALDSYLDFKSALEMKVNEILILKCNIENDNLKGFPGDIEQINFEAGMVEIKTIESSNCSCCSDETHWYSFPISYLFDDNWMEDAKSVVARKKADKERKDREEQELREKEEEERDRKEFERLQAKFGK